jgi:hypothetical protein
MEKVKQDKIQDAKIQMEVQKKKLQVEKQS